MKISRGEELGMKKHHFRTGDGKGGWKWKTGQFRFLHTAGYMLMPFGLAQMDDGEVVLIGALETILTGTLTADKAKVVVAFSQDRGDTWSDWTLVDGAESRPMMLAYMGNGKLTFVSEGPFSPISGATANRFFSTDYGRNWVKSIPVQPAGNGRPWWTEGNPLVEPDASGNAVRIAEIGYNYADGAWPQKPCDAFFRWSLDGGRTWTNEVSPKEWLWHDTYEGRTYARSVCEGSLVRADNGWLVAALRTDVGARWIPSGNDNYCGAGVSISKDDGQTWTPVQIIHRGGRMHMHFVKMPNADLVMIYVMRQDIAPDGIHYASYRRGCAALVSQDNGLTWDVFREYRLHEFDFATSQEGPHEGISALACGHTCSTLLDDGRILTAYGHYISNGIGLIRWQP